MRALALLPYHAVTCSLATTAQEKSKQSDVEGKILAQETVWNHAEQSKDINALFKIFAVNMTYIDELLAHVKAETDSPGQLVTGRRRYPCLRRLHRGHRCVSRQVSKNGKNTVLRGRFTDTWAKIDGNWQCVASQATGIAH